MSGVVVLSSGGVDSGVLVHRAHAAGELVGMLFADYGQPAALEEWRAVQALRRHLGITCPLHELPLTTIYAAAMSTMPGERGPRVVPARNLILIGHALNLAEHLGADRVWYGAIYEDRDNYPDCRPTFVSNLNAALSAYHGPTQSEALHPTVSAPLGATRKPAVIEEARAAGILDLCWSCYAPQSGRPCGGCDSCVVRGAP